MEGVLWKVKMLIIHTNIGLKLPLKTFSTD